MLRIARMRRRIFIFIFRVGIHATRTPAIRHLAFAAQKLNYFYKTCDNHNFSPEMDRAVSGALQNKF
jgi:hypothetical protein